MYSEDRRLLNQQTIPSNGRYRFIDLRDGRYEIAVEVENVEVARVRVIVSAPFKTDFRQDLEFQWRDKSASARAEVVSAADLYNRSTANADLFRKAAEASEKKKFAEAIRLLRQIVETDPKDFPAWTEIGTIYFEKKQFDEAEKAYLTAIALKPDFMIALMNLGKLDLTQKKSDQAIVTFTKAAIADRNSADAFQYLGESYLMAKQGSKAVIALNEAIRIDPVAMADVHLRLASLYDAAGMKDKAAAEYKMFLEKRPKYPEKEKLEAYIKSNSKP